jgi:hypothetical protein
MIQRWGLRNNTRLATEFAASAQRLAASFQGESVDDVILLPYLYLYRHAIELALKETILLAAWMRRIDGDESEEMQKETVDARLQNKHRHRLGALLVEVEGHFRHFGYERFPPDASGTLTWLSQADSKGEAFRYTGDLPDTWDNIDFHKLDAALADLFGIAMAGMDMLEAHKDSQLGYLQAMADQMPNESDYY